MKPRIWATSQKVDEIKQCKKQSKLSEEEEECAVEKHKRLS